MSELLDQVTSPMSEVKGSSMMDTLRQKRNELVEGSDTYLDIPGYSGLLVGRYSLLDSEEVVKIGKRVERQFKDKRMRGLYGSVDIIAQACQGLYYRTEDTGELQPVDPDGTGTPLTYDQRLATELGFEATTAREVIFGVFADNDIAILKHGGDLNAWFADTSRNANESFLGE